MAMQCKGEDAPRKEAGHLLRRRRRWYPLWGPCSLSRLLLYPLLWHTDGATLASPLCTIAATNLFVSHGIRKVLSYYFISVNGRSDIMRRYRGSVFWVNDVKRFSESTVAVASVLFVGSLGVCLCV